MKRNVIKVAAMAGLAIGLTFAATTPASASPKPVSGASWDGSRWGSAGWDGSRWGSAGWDGSRWGSAGFSGNGWS